MEALKRGFFETLAGRLISGSKGNAPTQKSSRPGHLGVPDSFHLLSHHQNDPEKIEKLVRIQAFHTRMFAAFIRALAELPDGDGTILDRSIVLYGSNMSDSHAHDHFPLPLAVVGGTLHGGQHLHSVERTPISNLLLTVLRRAEVPVHSIGDSTGECAGL